MGQASSRIAKGVLSPFTQKTTKETPPNNQLLVSPFVYVVNSGLYVDEDGFVANEFYVQVHDRATGRRTMKKNDRVRPYGEIKLDIPRIKVDLPIVICEAPS
ncbi:DgyrCDS4804 [Dimorphilus gyrociliatus]|uniref:DgyrCDS4804 n=1 Tax=Dimorphilus gyrociliatus TaxID=2664684 RepID=A0A7I8VKP6_9ANNE|nr:DgyrCDS4804 [Dimorphilus gyrociliatus]